MWQLCVSQGLEVNGNVDRANEQVMSCSREPALLSKPQAWRSPLAYSRSGLSSCNSTTIISSRRTERPIEPSLPIHILSVLRSLLLPYTIDLVSRNLLVLCRIECFEAHHLPQQGILRVFINHHCIAVDCWLLFLLGVGVGLHLGLLVDRLRLDLVSISILVRWSVVICTCGWRWGASSARCCFAIANRRSRP